MRRLASSLPGVRAARLWKPDEAGRQRRRASSAGRRARRRPRRSRVWVFHRRMRRRSIGTARAPSSDGSSVPGNVSTSSTSRTRRGSLRAVRPRRIALRVAGPVLIANGRPVDLQADERARELGIEFGGELRGRGTQRALHALAFGGAQLAEPLVLHPGQRRHEQHDERRRGP